MKPITLPKDQTLYPNIADTTLMKARMKLGSSRLSISYRKIAGGIQPTLDIDFYNESRKLYSIRYNLPPDTPERTDRRISLLMRLIEEGITVAPIALAS